MRVGAGVCPVTSRDGRAPHESALRQLRLLQPGEVNHARVVDEEKGEKRARDFIHGFRLYTLSHAPLRLKVAFMMYEIKLLEKHCHT